MIVLGIILTMLPSAYAGQDGGYEVATNLWTKAVLKPPAGDVALIWKAVGSDTTPSGDQVISGYFYADPTIFEYGSVYNPEVFVKIYIAANGWTNIAFNHVTVDDVDVFSAYRYAGTADKTGTLTLSERLVEHTYEDTQNENDQNPENTDDDGDGYSEDQGDCDDSNFFVHPGAQEVYGDGIDQDCDGSDPTPSADTGRWEGVTDRGDRVSFNVSPAGDVSYFLILATDPSNGQTEGVITQGDISQSTESEPFMGFIDPSPDTDPSRQWICYYAPVGIESDRTFRIENSVNAFVDQSILFSGKFNDADTCTGNWSYTIDGSTASGTWSTNRVPSNDETVATVTKASIVIDGSPSDWTDIPPVYIDPEGDEDPLHDYSGTDMGAVYVAYDDDYAYFAMTLYDGGPNTTNAMYSMGLKPFPGFGSEDIRVHASTTVEEFDRIMVSVSKIINIDSDDDFTKTLYTYEETKLGSGDAFTHDHVALGDGFIEWRVPMSAIGTIFGRYINPTTEMLGGSPRAERCHIVGPEASDGMIRFKCPATKQMRCPVNDYQGGSPAAFFPAIRPKARHSAMLPAP